MNIQRLKHRKGTMRRRKVPEHRMVDSTPPLCYFPSPGAGIKAVIISPSSP